MDLSSLYVLQYNYGERKQKKKKINKFRIQIVTSIDNSQKHQCIRCIQYTRKSSTHTSVGAAGN